MKRLSVDLKNCYGIKELAAKFDFDGCKANAIYAPNGAMKSSLAKTFQDLAANTPSKDRIFPARECTRSIKDQTGAEVDAACILVVQPYDEVLGHSEKTSTLLVNAALRQEYEKLAAAKRKQEIEEQAAKERTDWEQVIEIFNSRFFVPFKLTAKNRISVILGQEPMLSLGFTFEDGGDSAPMEKAALIDVLSTGEKKALYVLNIIFEIQARVKAGQETLLVVDDIADSFDYKNKYAIIQYLKDVAEEAHFKQIILTHNFDFFRTIQSRFVKYSHCYMASKSSKGLTLKQASGIQNVFIKDWKKNFFSDHKKRIASIPFIRNLLEFTKGDNDADYVKLTSLLHWKADSAGITESDLDQVYGRLFGANGEAAPDGTLSVVDLVHKTAAECLKADEGINFENKIVLSIAVRLGAERFMVTKISDAVFVAGIDANQTPALLMKFREKFPKSAAIETIQKVVLMTPENIHLNSFMYEPILDMSDEHLRRLYGEVLTLA